MQDLLVQHRGELVEEHFDDIVVTQLMRLPEEEAVQVGARGTSCTAHVDRLPRVGLDEPALEAPFGPKGVQGGGASDTGMTSSGCVCAGVVGGGTTRSAERAQQARVHHGHHPSGAARAWPGVTASRAADKLRAKPCARLGCASARLERAVFAGFCRQAVRAAAVATVRVWVPLARRRVRATYPGTSNPRTSFVAAAVSGCDLLQVSGLQCARAV
jgi:hypothetical protein